MPARPTSPRHPATSLRVALLSACFLVGPPAAFAAGVSTSSSPPAKKPAVQPASALSSEPSTAPSPASPRASVSTPPRALPAPWSDADPRIAADVKAGKPLVISVVVPLCDGGMLDCGSGPAGRPGDLTQNLYWGAIFGQRRFLDRPRSGWERVEATTGEGPLLERIIYRRKTTQAAWGGAAEAPLEQLLVIQAVHGKSIDQAVAMFWSTATRGGEVRFVDEGRERVERIHVAGYAGHNRLMDRSATPLLPAGDAPIPSFVMACSSEAYFSDPLRDAGSAALLLTRTLMAPEGYVVEALVRALGDNLPRAAVRSRVVDAYASFQRSTAREAGRVFAVGR
ncbi:hypothetical protein [Chondromyces crocatus]|uniref:CHAT domain-containing protein n=1 Tax=Chondromyces crocatus TaxID=52 RepID=A0A0K1EQ89_CHOCO|nr:hypothetical protein [Chondromyces crocatus]AKT43070.1 uncharacterized protein CMC5_072980 [Chondromyces crocatus]